MKKKKIEQIELIAKYRKEQCGKIAINPEVLKQKKEQKEQ